MKPDQLSQAQVRALDKLAMLGVSLAPKNDRTMIALETRGYAMRENIGTGGYRWKPTKVGIEVIAAYQGRKVS